MFVLCQDGTDQSLDHKELGMYDFSKVGCMKLDDMVYDKLAEISELQEQMIDENGLWGVDLHYAKIVNTSLSLEIKAIRNFITTVKEEIYKRKKIK